MLYITLDETDKTLYTVDVYFDLHYELAWLDDTKVREMIYDVDRSVVESSQCIKSPVLGQIPPQKLSGGVKALILMLKTNKQVWATACGDNCAKWITEISNMKDLHICLQHAMEFPDNHFEFIYELDGQTYWYDDFIDYVFIEHLDEKDRVPASQLIAEGKLDDN